MSRGRKQTIKNLIKQKEREQEVKNKYNIDNNATVIIEKKNIFLQVLNFLVNISVKVLKLIFLVAIAILSSIGLTVLVNEPLRNVFLELVSKSFM